MIPLSTRSKESIKVALAMAIAYAIALTLGWEKPFWAGFAVAMISLDTAGASFNKAAMRMLGTLVAGAAALTILALFPQERWDRLICLSIYLGFCVYMLTGPRHQYFWFVSAFVTLVIMIDSAPTDSLRAFQITVARVEETGMGILVYSLISTFLWPRSTRRDLEAASRDLAAAQAALYRQYRGLMSGQGTAEESRPLRSQVAQLVTQVGGYLAASETDSYAVWELRQQWRRYRHLSGEVMETMERWREAIPQLREIELSKPLPGLEPFCAELELRFAEVARLLAGGAPEHLPAPVGLKIDLTETRALGHFEKAALAVAKAQLDRLDELTRSLLETAGEIRGFRDKPAEAPVMSPRRRGFEIDTERLGAAATTVATLWIAFLIWIYVDPPGHALFTFMATLWVMISAMARQPPSSMTSSFLIGIALGGGLYTFVMPNLSGYLELGLMIFGVTFAICYLCWPPQRRMLRPSVLALFNVLMSIDNQQTYDFAGFMNTGATVLLSLALAVATTFIPPSPRPEKTFLRLLRRYFLQADFMLSRLALDRDRKRGWLQGWKTALYSGDLLTLPEKMGALGRRVDYRALPGDTPEKVQALVAQLQAIAYRIDELLEARELPHAEVLVQEFRDELRAWREVVQEQVRLWAEDPAEAGATVADLESRLAARIERLDARIEATYRKGETAALSERDYENFFRYLGGLRGLSDAGIGFLRIARTVDWPKWREARF